MLLILDGLSRQQPQEGALHAFLQLLLCICCLDGVRDVFLQVWLNVLTPDVQPA